MSGPEDASEEGADAGVPPGFRGLEEEELPEWWREIIGEFEAAAFPRTYHPPRFSDGVVLPEAIEEVESRFGVEVDLVGVDAALGDDWTIRVDGEAVGTVSRRRSTDGYTEYGMDSEAFVELVRSHVEGE